MIKFEVRRGTPPTKAHWGISKDALCPVCNLYPVRRHRFSWYVSGYDVEHIPYKNARGEHVRTRIFNQVHAWVCSKDCADLLIIQKM